MRLDLSARSASKLKELRGTALAAMLGLFAIAAAVTLVQVSSVASAGYDIQRLEAQRDAARQALYRLEYDVSELESLGRVEREATQRLKMVQPPSLLWVTVATAPVSSKAPVRPATTTLDGRENEPAFLAWVASLGDRTGAR